MEMQQIYHNRLLARDGQRVGLEGLLRRLRRQRVREAQPVGAVVWSALEVGLDVGCALYAWRAGTSA